jgi:O-acetyl-ADP-ribose deacetylase (regulator of RNase III)
MIKTTAGDIFKSEAECIVNPVNCIGVMGKGLALKFKRKYNKMFIDYVMRCREGQVKTGQPYLYKAEDRLILNFPTKQHWRDPSKLEYIEAGLKYFARNYRTWEITSIAFPKLGCGCGGLDWEKDVKPLMYKYLGNLEDITVYLSH